MNVFGNNLYVCGHCKLEEEGRASCLLIEPLLVYASLC